MDDKRYMEIADRLAAITPGEWYWDKAGDLMSLVEDGPHPLGAVISCGEWENGLIVMTRKRDAEFIAHAPQDIRDLLQEIDNREMEIYHLMEMLDGRSS